MKTEKENTPATITDDQLLKHINNLGLAKDLSEGERNTYLEIAKAFNLNPFKREIHVSKYNGQMTLITGYEVYIKRAERTGALDGWEVTTTGSASDNTLKAIITIYRKDRKYPFKHEVLYSEYVQKTASGAVTKFWQKAHTMIKKVAMSQGFRLCFSDELGGMPYTQEEMPEQNSVIETTAEIQTNVKKDADAITPVVVVVPKNVRSMDEIEQILSQANDLKELSAAYKSLSIDEQADLEVIEMTKSLKTKFEKVK